jgi:DNA-binding CsgD family transcriptional regulator
MPTLPGRDIEALLRFVYDASTYNREASFPSDLVARLHGLVPAAEVVSYCELDLDRRCVAYEVEHSLVDVEFECADDETFWQLHDQDPLCDYFARTGDLRPRKMSDLLRPREWRAHEFYNAYFRPFQYELDLRLPGRRDYTKTFMFHSSGRDFGERDRLVLELLQPHLQRLDETFEGRQRIRADLPLTRREREILGWVERGETNAEIAQILWISPATVRKHLENAYEKLGVRTRTAAVACIRGDQASARESTSAFTAS